MLYPFPDKAKKKVDSVTGLPSFFLLLAGAGAYYTPALGGALAFIVNVSPSGAGWDLGSANKNISIPI